MSAAAAAEHWTRPGQPELSMAAAVTAVSPMSVYLRGDGRRVRAGGATAWTRERGEPHGGYGHARAYNYAYMYHEGLKLCCRKYQSKMDSAPRKDSGCAVWKIETGARRERRASCQGVPDGVAADDGAADGARVDAASDLEARRVGPARVGRRLGRSSRCGDGKPGQPGRVVPGLRERGGEPRQWRDWNCHA